MSKTTLVLGASVKPERYSNIAIHKLVEKKLKVLALGFQEGEVNGVKIDTKIMQYQDVDTVTLYLNPKRQEAFYYYIISLTPRRVIFNPGTENEEFYTLLIKHGIQVEEACTLVLLSTDQY